MRVTKIDQIYHIFCDFELKISFYFLSDENQPNWSKTPWCATWSCFSGEYTAAKNAFSNRGFLQPFYLHIKNRIVFYTLLLAKLTKTLTSVSRPLKLKEKGVFLCAYMSHLMLW